MRKQLSLLMFVAALLLPWVTKAQGSTISSFPFTCNFEDAADNAYWSFQNASNGWHIGAAVTNGGDSALYVSDNGGTANSYSGSECVSYAYLTFDIANPGQYALQFDWKCNGESTYDFLRVAVAPASTALPTSYSSWTATAVPTGFVAVDGGNKLNLNGTSWTTQTAAISVTTAGVYRLVFAWRNDGSVYNQPPAAIDNVIVAELTCPQPVNLTALPASDQIDFTWSPGGSESQWLVELCSATDTVTDVVYDSTYTALNLTPQTMYTFSVYALCGGDDTSLATSTEVRTLCVPLDSLPYFENFDGHTTSTTAATGIQVPCWDAILTGTATYQTGSYVPQIYYSSSYAHSGSYSYRLYGVGYHSLPPMPASLDSLRLSFWDYTTSTSYGLEVGVMEGNTFVPVQVISSPASTHVEYNIYFTGYTGNSRVIAFRNYYTSGSTTYYYSYHYLDNIKVDYKPSCPDIVSHNVTATASAARIEWAYDLGLGITPDEYEIRYGYASDSLAGATTVTSTTTSLVLTGLDADTSYMVSIVSNCTDGNGSAYTFTFNTQALACLVWDTTNGGPASPAATYVVGTPGTSTTNVMPVNGGYNYSYCNHLILRSDISSVPSGTTYFSGIDFQYAGSSPMTAKNNCAIYMCHTSMTVCDNFADTADLVLVYEGPLNCTDNGWNHFEFNRGTFAYNGTGNIIVAIVDNSGSTDANESFYYASFSDSRSHRVYRDNAPYTFAELGTVTAGNSVWRTNMRLTTGGSGGGTCLTQASCAAPAVTLGQNSDGDIELSWIPGYQETSWDVDYRRADTTDWTSALAGTTNTSYTFLLSDLQPNTEYEFRVSPNCTDTVISTTVSFTTPCGFFNVPFSEDFETFSTTAANPLPSCWDKHTNYSTNYPYASTTYHHSGSKAMYMYSTNSTYSYMVLPQFNLPIDSTVVSFWLYKSNSSYAHSLQVGVMTDPDNVSTFVQVATVTPTALSTWEPFEVSLHSYTGTGRYIAIMSPNGVYSYPYLDDLLVDRLSSCPRVANVVVDNITTNDATVSWDTTTAFDYEVQYGPAGFTFGTGTTIAVSGVDSVDITGLSPNTAYDVYVRGICSPDTGNWSYTYTFRTECGRINILPWTENFESFATTSSQTDLPCWTYIGNGSGYNNIATPAGTGNNSSRCYRFMPGSTTPLYAILPTFEQSTSGLILSMKVRAESTTSSGTLVIGYVDDSNHFTNVMTVTPTNTDWNDVEVSFPGAPDSARIAIGQNTVSTNYYWWIDDIEVADVPACARVVDITIGNTLTTEATISWLDTSATNSSWWVEYDSTDFLPGSGAVTPISVTDTFYTITGLDSGTVYYVYVYPDCSGNIAVRGTTFTTLAASPATVPYSCNFEAAGSNGWDLLNGSQTNYWTVGSATNNGGSKALYVTNNGTDNSYTNTTISYSYAVRAFNLTDSGEYAYSFDWKGQGEGNYDFVRALFVPASMGIEAGALNFGSSAYNYGQTVAPAPWIDLTGKTSAPYGLNGQATWQNRTGVMHISTPGTYKLVFAWVNDGSGGTTPPAAIDNVSLVRNTCSMPQNVTAALTSDSISVTWTPGGSESAWELTLDSTTVVATTPAYTFTGLSPNTNYSFSIRAICGLGDSSLVYTETYHTPCDVVPLPYSESFDSLTTGTATSSLTVMPSCWEYILTGTSTYQGATYYPGVYYSSSYAHSGSYCLRLYGVGYFMLPPMSAPLDSLQLTFWNYTTSTSYGLEVGVMEGNTFVPIQDVTPTASSTHTQTTVYFGTYTGNSRIIAFRNYYTTSATTYYSYNYIDDVVVEYLPTCPPVVGLTDTAATTTSITVDWIDQTTAASWEVEYIGNGITNSIVVMAHPATISGLTPATAYQIRVRPICSTTDTGHWSEPINAFTGCDLITPPYLQDFNAVIGTSYSTAGSLPPCWDGYSNGTTAAYMPHVTDGNTYSYSVSGNPLTMTSGSATYGDTKFVRLPQFATPVNTLTMSFWMCTESSTNGYLLVGYMTSNDYSTFVTVDSIHASSATIHSGNGAQPAGYGIYDTVSFESVPATAQYIAFKWVYTTSYYSCCIDDVEVTTSAPSCPAPVITSTAATDQTITVNFNGSSASYEVAVVEDAWVAPTTGTPVADTTYTFTGLTDMTNYYIGVRAACGGTYSEWVTLPVTTLRHPCAVPTAVEVSDRTYDGATVSWTAGEAETDWQVRVFCASPVYDDTIDVSGTPGVVITGLANDAVYSVAVRAVCDSAWMSLWSDTVTLTPETCPQVTGVGSSNVTFNAATITWNPSGADSYELEYGNTGFQQGSGHTATSNTASFNLTGLEEMTTYDVFVRSVCATGVTSEWSAKYTFTTPENNGIDDVAGSDVTLFPNPASTMVTIRGIEGESTVTVVDLNGREVYKTSANDNLTIDLTGYAKGAYFVRITGERTTAIRKLIVK